MTFSYVLLPPFIACLFSSRFGMALHTPTTQERDREGYGDEKLNDCERWPGSEVLNGATTYEHPSEL